MRIAVKETDLDEDLEEDIFLRGSLMSFAHDSCFLIIRPLNKKKTDVNLGHKISIAFLDFRETFKDVQSRCFELFWPATESASN